jgi:hypothetical protein
MTTTQTVAPAENRSRTLRRALLRAEAAQQAPEPLPQGAVPPEERDRMIAEAAYFRAEQRGFAPGAELDDWLEAEIEVAHLLGGEKPDEVSS